MSSASFIDLARIGKKVHSERCDVCVLGAGAAGIYLATDLAARGLDVVLLEAGGTRGATGSALGIDPLFGAENYPGATVGRFFGLGGSTSRWGGLLVPHTHHDLRKGERLGFDPWRHIVQTASERAGSVLQRLGWGSEGRFSGFAQDHFGDGGEALLAAGLDVFSGLFLPFRKKNLIWMLKKDSTHSSRLKVFFNAVARGWHVAPHESGARIVRAEAVSRSGNRLTVTASRFVVAAGALESARLLLEIDHELPQPIVRESSAVGCYLADHLSMPIADVPPVSMAATIKLFAPRFSKGWMRSFRFVEVTPPPNAPRAFSHFVFENENPGFSLAKEGLGALQGRRLPKASAGDITRGFVGMVRLAYGRFVRSTLYIPSNTKTRLQLDIEQVPVRGNAIRLGHQFDSYGRRVATIDWRISESDLESGRLAAKRILENWSASRWHLPSLSPRLDDCGATKPHDAYHPVGTCRLGRDREAVVDENLRVWGVENLWVVSTGVLPSAGTANPTFTMLCLAERLARQLSANGRVTA